MIERLVTHENLLTVFSMLPVFALPFSNEVRKLIGKRADWRSEWSGKAFRDGWLLHMAHKNHDKNNPLYDDPSMGICLTVDEHQQMHEDAVGRAKDIGLTEAQNDYAIRKLKETPRRTKEWLERNR